MTKLLIVGDLHFSEFSSIIRKKGMRLNLLVKTLNWIVETAFQEKCDSIIFLGDFFDKPELNAEELTALKEVKWDESLNYYCLVGNHEMGLGDLSVSSTHILNLIPNFKVIDKPTIIQDKYLFLPYIKEDKARVLKNYTNNISNLIIFSHNDLKGIQMGQFLSKEGFDVDEIGNNCRLFINGHIHNRGIIRDKIINIGNISGQNFSEDALKYPHLAMVLDTSNSEYVEVSDIENPFAFNFYKLDLTFYNKENLFKHLPTFKNHSIVSVKCLQSCFDSLKEFINSLKEIEEYRIISVPDNINSNSSNIEELTKVDYLEEFKKYILENVDSSDYTIKELQEVCK